MTESILSGVARTSRAYVRARGPARPTAGAARYGAEVGTGFIAWAWDSIRVTDTNTLKTRSIPADQWGFSWSPDGHYLIEGGYNTLIATPDGHRFATLARLNAIEPSWQPLCRPASRQ